MSLHLFAGLRVRDFEAARPWYERLLGEPTFFPHATEAVWTFAEDRSLYIVEHADGASNSGGDDLPRRSRCPRSRRGLALTRAPSDELGASQAAFRPVRLASLRSSSTAASMRLRTRASARSGPFEALSASAIVTPAW